jgi:hypothetical protein
MPFPLHLPSLLSAQALLLALAPHGGQQTARRNAWAAMSVDAARARARREAAAAVNAAATRHAGVAERAVP